MDRMPAVESASEVTDNQQAAPAQQESAPQVTDLDAMPEFSFQGKKLTPEALAKVFGEYEQFSESHKAYTQQQEYFKHLKIDLQSVLKDPSLAGEFKSTYPEQFHALLDVLLSRQEASKEAPQSASAQLPKEFLSEFNQVKSKLSHYERMAHEAEVAKSEAYLQQRVDPMFEKYQFATPDAVYAKAEALINQGYKMTDSAWERLIKESHQANEKRFEQIHQAKLKTQIDKNNQAKDVGAGGNAVASAPQRPKSFSEAREAMLKELGVR